MIHSILKYGAPQLRNESKPVESFGKELEKIANDMIETMYSSPGLRLLMYEMPG